MLGLLIGPSILGWVQPTEFTEKLSDFGLAMLFFLAGNEIDFQRIRGRALNRSIVGWLLSLVAGVASFAVFAILGVPFAVPLAFVVAVCDLIPTIGATLGAVICVLAALLTTDLWPTTVVVAIFFVLYQQVENYFIAPRILRSTVSLSAPAVLLSGLIGGTVLGLIGALMAIPIAAGLKVVLGERLQARDSADADADADADAEVSSRAGARLNPFNTAPRTDPTVRKEVMPWRWPL